MAKTGVVSVEISIEKHLIVELIELRRIVIRLAESKNEDSTLMRQYWHTLGIIRNYINLLLRLESREPTGIGKFKEADAINIAEEQLQALWTYPPIHDYKKNKYAINAALDNINNTIRALEGLKQMELRLG